MTRNHPFSHLQQILYSAVVCDALDSLGRTQQAVIQLHPLTCEGVLIGRCRTTLWSDMAHKDPDPYALELKAVDSLVAGDVMVAGANGSMRSGIWGELLSTAARNSGCVGAVVDGAIRDITKMTDIGFPAFARGNCPLDSKDRQRVIECDVPIDVDGVRVCPGDLVVADVDGVVFVPAEIENEVIEYATDKATKENEVRNAILSGMKATEAYRQYGVL